MRQDLAEKKAVITKVAEEMDAWKQELPDEYKDRINRLLNRIDEVVPILPSMPQTDKSIPDNVKRETDL